jgi:hypothetical protein
MAIVFSNHALEQIALRQIHLSIIKDILEFPQQTIKEDDQTIYQSIINFEDTKYLVRVFVNTKVEPNKIITVYRTSKIKKYYEG